LFLARRVAAAKENYPSSRDFRELDRVLKRVDNYWPLKTTSNKNSTLALRLFDDQRALDSFLRRKTKLKLYYTENCKAFDASVGGAYVEEMQAEVRSDRVCASVLVP
jgi:hypothetical protein